MTLIVTVYVREGIVMASDSRLTLTTTQEQAEKKVVQLVGGWTDSTYKTFLAPNKIGMSTYGAADVQGVPVAGFIESFITEKLTQEASEPEQVARKLLEYFGKMPGPPAVQFHVAGYSVVKGQLDQQVLHVDVSAGAIKPLNPPGLQGASWGGEADVLTRMILPVGRVDEQGKLSQLLPHFDVPWQFFTLQDAIDFAVYAIRTTIDSIRFQTRSKTVGGPIDVLIVKPDGARWVQRKELRVT